MLSFVMPLIKINNRENIILRTPPTPEFLRVVLHKTTPVKIRIPKSIIITKKGHCNKKQLLKSFDSIVVFIPSNCLNSTTPQILYNMQTIFLLGILWFYLYQSGETIINMYIQTQYNLSEV